MFYTMIDHALSTTDSARNIQTYNKCYLRIGTCFSLCVHRCMDVLRKFKEHSGSSSSPHLRFE